MNYKIKRVVRFQNIWNREVEPLTYITKAFLNKNCGNNSTIIKKKLLSQDNKEKKTMN